MFVSDGRKITRTCRRTSRSTSRRCRPTTGVDAGAVPGRQGQLCCATSRCGRPGARGRAGRQRRAQAGSPRQRSRLRLARPGRGRASLEWRMLVTGDQQGGESTFTFTNLKENAGLPTGASRSRFRVASMSSPIGPAPLPAPRLPRAWSRPARRAGGGVRHERRSARRPAGRDGCRTTTAPSSNTPRRCAGAPDDATRASRSTARSCARPRTTSPAAAGSPRPASSRRRSSRRRSPPSSTRPNGDIDDALRTTRRSCATRSPSRARARPSSKTLIDRTRDLPPPGLDLPDDVKLPASLMFRDASSRDVFTALARFANINVIVRPGVPRVAGHDRPAQRARSRTRCTPCPARTHNSIRVTAPRTDHDHPRHAGQAPRVRRRSRPDVLSEQRRSQGNDRPAAIVVDARRIAPITAHQRAHDQGHAGAHRGRRRA